jgi:hypothetical protein
MQRLFIFILIIIACIPAQSQNTIGIPNILNYSKQEYNAGSQNWGIAQDKRGIVYFANNNGLLSFDGTFWRLYQLPNKTIARSVTIGPEGRIYVGGQGEIGYFFPDERGELKYTSLNKLVATKDKDFADVWNICIYHGHVFFRANKKILEFNGQTVQVYNSINWGYLGVTGDELIANEYDLGLVILRNGQWVKKLRSGQLPAQTLLKSSVVIGQDSTLLITLFDGLFLIHHDTLSPFVTADTKEIISKNPFAGAMISGDRIALVTNLGGCFIIDKKGKYIQRFTKKEGIQNNNILSMLIDRDKNLWLGLDNGIDLVTYSNAIKNIFPEQEDRNAGYTSLVANHHLYLGVSTGVFTVPLDSSAQDLSYSNGTFSFVENSKGQVWGLANVNGQVLMGHNKGAYLIENNNAELIDNKTGFWGFYPLYDSIPSKIVMGGTYNGINFYRYEHGKIFNPIIHAQFESARFVVNDNGVIWVAHPYKGLYKVVFDKNGNPLASTYQDKKGILSSNHNKVFKVDDKVILSTDKGLFEFDHQANDFVHSTYYEDLFGHIPVSYLKNDMYGNTWFCRDRKVGIVDRSSGKPRIIFIPELDDRITAGGFENINIIDSNNVFIAGEKGFYHLNYALYKKNKQSLRVLIRNVQAPLQNDSLIFGGHSDIKTAPRISYNNNALHFEWSSSLFGQEHNTEYSYYLQGFDKSWSDWSRKTEKDYTNIPAGDYSFKVKCRNNFDNESPVTSFSFTVLPPWYMTWWAWTFYVLIFASLLFLFYKRQQRKYKKLQLIKLQEQQRKYDEEQKQLQILHQLEIGESEKKIVELQNEKLKAEVTHKNSELASSAMNLVRKKEMLSKLKEDLTQFKESAEIEKGGREFQKVIGR